jgi:hypothetical protein
MSMGNETHTLGTQRKIPSYQKKICDLGWKEDCLVVIMGRSFLFKTTWKCVFGVL